MEEEKIKCIYCLDEKLASDFNREHIIPRSLATFKQDWVLRQAVCIKCNKTLGDELDLVLSRGSIEGVYRFDYGKETKGKINNKRIRSEIINGKHKGLKGQIVPHNGEKGITVENLVGIYNKVDNKYQYFTLSEIPQWEELVKNESLDLDNIVIEYNEKEGKQEFHDALKLKGIGLVITKDEPNSKKALKKEVTVKAKFLIDRVVFRAISKIGMNYLCKVVGKEFVLKKEFNDIRNFIRNGVLSRSIKIEVNTESLNIDSSLLISPKQKNHHIIKTYWGRNNKSIFIDIYMYDFIHYRIQVVDNYDGVWIPINFCHKFIIDTKEVEKKE